MQYAHRNFLITVNRAEEDGTLLTMTGEIPIKKGELIGCDLEGNSFPIPDTRFNEYYVPVQRVKEKPVRKQPSPFEELYAQQIAEFNGTLKQDESDLHIRNNNLISDKAL